MRQIVLDTETTGLEPELGHRVIEIGCVEMIDRKFTENRFHHYLNPEREIDEAALEIHGITQEFLQDKPRFHEIAAEMLAFVKDAELIIHNADFDIGFLDNELGLVDPPMGKMADYCAVVDTLTMARRTHPGQRNSLDALCKRYNVDNSNRTLHGALLDAEILADVYLAMTGGQTTFLADLLNVFSNGFVGENKETGKTRYLPTPIIKANREELDAHEKWLELLDKESGGKCLWRELNETSRG